jgi:hypothetical protein
MDHAGWQLAGGLILLIMGAVVGRFTAPKNDCSKCGLMELKTELKAEITRLCNLVRALAEKVNLSVKEQLEIERLERG